MPRSDFPNETSDRFQVNSDAGIARSLDFDKGCAATAKRIAHHSIFCHAEIFNKGSGDLGD